MLCLALFPLQLWAGQEDREIDSHLRIIEEALKDHRIKIAGHYIRYIEILFPQLDSHRRAQLFRFKSIFFQNKLNFAKAIAWQKQAFLLSKQKSDLQKWLQLLVQFGGEEEIEQALDRYASWLDDKEKGFYQKWLKEGKEKDRKPSTKSVASRRLPIVFE